MSAAAATVVSKVTALAAVLVVALFHAQRSSSSPSLEDSNHYCGQYENGGWGTCDTGRCCGYDDHCDKSNCAPSKCQYYCPDPDQVLAAGGLVNATVSKHDYYLDVRSDGGDGVGGRVVMKPGVVNVSSSASASATGSGLLSCAGSLARLSPAARRRYSWAALGVAARDSNSTTAVCGQCLKVTRVGAREGGAQAKVRIVHVHEVEGLELDDDTFRELVAGGGSADDNGLMVKYQFESC